MDKYPRTPHLVGSRLQPGDHDLARVPFAAIRGRYVVIEEKLDGANAGISFGPDGELRLQSRGHYLSGGPRERQFAPLKAWAASIAADLWPVLRDRYTLYGEWLFAKHTQFYDALPHYFCEFDVLDRGTGEFLSTSKRARLLAGTPIVSVPVLHAGVFDTLDSITALIGPSTCRSADWRGALLDAARDAGLDPDRVAGETDMSGEMEGLYLKVEDTVRTIERYKWVRAGFLQTLDGSGSHWADRPIVANRLRDPAVLYGRV